MKSLRAYLVALEADVIATAEPFYSEGAEPSKHHKKEDGGHSEGTLKEPRASKLLHGSRKSRP